MRKPQRSEEESAADFERMLNESRLIQCACPCHDRSSLPRSVKPTSDRCCLHLPWQFIDESRRKAKQR